MAYTTPSTQVTGYVVTASDWNELVNNWIASGLKAVTTDGDMIVATGTNAVERVSVMNGSNLLKHEVGGIELNISAITTGGLLIGASSGVMEILAYGSDGEVLTGGSGKPSWAPAAGALVHIETVEATNDASITLNTISNSYDRYVIQLSDLHPATNNAELWLRLGDSGGIDSGPADYEWIGWRQYIGNTGYAYSSDASDSEIMISDNVGDQPGESLDGTIYLGRSDATGNNKVMGQTIYHSGTPLLLSHVWVAARKTVLTLTQAQILFSSGNIISGSASLYGYNPS